MTNTTIKMYNKIPYNPSGAAIIAGRGDTSPNILVGANPSRLQHKNTNQKRIYHAFLELTYLIENLTTHSLDRTLDISGGIFNYKN